MTFMNFLSHEQFSDRLIILTEGYSMVHRFTIGVIIGDEKIMVIDSGLGGYAYLRSYIENLVGRDKPIICACTHGHLDHVGSACLFDEAYCSLKDFGPGKNDPFDPMRRYCDIIDFSLESNLVMDYCKTHMLMDNRVDFKDIRDGDIFDLGGVRIEAIAVPGHSDGSMAFYNAAEKYCFTGDAVNTDVHLKRLNREGFRSYRQVMENFISRVDPDTTLYPAHLPLPMSMDIPRNLARISQELADGNVAVDPPAEGIFHARKNDRNIRGHYYNNTCIVYNRGLISDEKFSPYDACYYSHEKWSERVYTVTINYSTVNRITLMVFVGDEKILVIDSGHGFDGKLRQYIESFVGSGKPIINAMTHIGIDHGGAAALFDEIYMHKLDIEKLYNMSKEKRYIDVQPFSNYSTEFAEYSYHYMLEQYDPALVKEVNDGGIFRLGNLDVEAIFTPGHSTGHMAYYCAAENVCFTGDAANVDTHLKSMTRRGLVDYVSMLQNLMNRIRPDTVTFSSHLNRPHGMRVPKNIMAACMEIANGQIYGDQPGEAIQQHIGAFHNSNIKMHYHGNCCVVYNLGTLDKA